MPSDTTRIPAREIRVPHFLSPGAKSRLAYPEPRAGAAAIKFPVLGDKQGWKAFIATIEANVASRLETIRPVFDAKVEQRNVDGVSVFDIAPAGVSPDSRRIILNFHGGGFVMCGGDLCRRLGVSDATRLKQRVWSVDYRMPPDFPYPVPLDDCLTAYRALLRERRPEETIVMGASSGGNLAPAMLLRARDEGLPMPAGMIIETPATDLTESSDSLNTNEGIDPSMPSGVTHLLELYANGHDLRDPYLSPVFGDFTKGFPPSLLTTGTRDLLLSDTVRMHRALRAADIPAELHIAEAAGHGGFPHTPEGEAIDRDIRLFIRRLWHDI